MKCNIAKSARITAVIIICFMCLIPFYVLAVLALNSPSRVFYEGNIFIPDFCFDNFSIAWEKSHLLQAMINSFIITMSTLFSAIVLGGLAGYAISRFKTKLNMFIFGLLLSCMMIPGIINTVPLYTLMRKFHLVNTLKGMILVCTTLALPSAVFIYTSFISTVPKELDEAAIIDGCGGGTVFWKIIFPLLKPATASFIILNGFGIWNNYAQSVFFLQSRAKHNIPQALSVFFQSFGGTKWNLMASAALIAIVPVIVIFLIFQREFIDGLAAGAIKG